MSQRFAGRYQEIRKLGRGGMGEVSLVLDLASGTQCALKHLPGEVRPEQMRALRSEFEALTRLQHPSLVRVRDLGFTLEATPFLTMDYVPGLPANEAFARQDHAALFWFAARLARGLEVLHGAGIVHGDLKPANVLVLPAAARDELPRDLRIVDFGLAVLRGGARAAFAGTPGFAAPELVAGLMPDVASDLYAFGALLHALITGEAPGAHRSDAALAATAGPDLAALEAARIPRALLLLVLRLLSVNPAERPSDAAEVAQELESMHGAARTKLAGRLVAESIVGRDRELTRISLAATHDRARALIVTGPAGIGRSTLLRQAALRTTLAHRVALHAQAQSSARGAAAVALVRSLVAALGVDTAALSPAIAALLTGTSHELPETAEAALLEALPAWLTRLADASGTPLIIVDDADELDPVSRRWLRRALVASARARAVWLWSMRTLEDAPEAALVFAGVVEPLALEPLSEADFALLLQARLGTEPPTHLVPWLERRAGRVPGATVRSLLAAAEAGALFEDGRVLLADAAKLAAIPALAGAEDAALAAFLALGPEARDVVLAIAACGALASTDALTGMLGRAPDVAAAVRAGLVHAPAEGQWSLISPLAAARFLATQGAGERHAWWQRALARPGLEDSERFRLLAVSGAYLEALALAERLYAGTHDLLRLEEVCALADSADAATILRWRERAVAVARSAGERARVLEHLDVILAHSTDAAQRSAAWALSARYEAILYHHEQAKARAARARQEYVAPADEGWLRLAETASPVLQRSDLRDAIDQAIEIARRCDDPWLLSEALSARSASELGLPDPAIAIATAHEALTQARRTGDSRATHFALRAYAHALQSGGRLHETRAELEPAIAQARRSGDRLSIERLSSPLVGVLVEMGAWGEARRTLAATLRSALMTGDGMTIVEALIQSAWLEALRGATPLALQRIGRAKRLLAKAGNTRQPDIDQVLAMAWRDLGHHRRAERLFERALSNASRENLRGNIVWARIDYAKLCTLRERWREVARIVAPAIRATMLINGDLVLLTLQGRARIRERDLTGAEEALRMARDWLAQHPSAYMHAHVHQLAAELSIAREAPDDALAHADRALAAFASLPATADQARAAYGLAQFAIDAGQADRLPVAAWIEQARERFQALGDARMCMRVLELELRLWRAGAPAAAAPATADPDLLEALSGLMMSMSALDELGRRAIALAVSRLGFERGVLLLEKGEAGAYERVASYGTPGGAAPHDLERYSETAIQHIRKTGESLYLGDRLAIEGMRSKSMADMRVQSIAVIPLRSGERIIGALYLQDSRREGQVGERDRIQLEGFAHLLSAAFIRSVGQQDIEEANARLTGENISLQRALGAQPEFDPADPIIGLDPLIQDVRMRTRQAAMSPASVLILGPTGTGKELVARELHRLSPRSARPFIAINCGVGPAGLIESEMFGIERNVATQVAARAGKFELANGGTLFLDEVADMPPALQVALLRVLQERVVTRIGGTRPIPLDVRIIAATNRDLAREAYEGRFRLDLFFRLAVIPIDLPPLRERRGDIPLLAHHLAGKLAARQGRPVPRLSRAFIQALVASDWPGNVRELENYIERILAMTPGDELHPVPPPRDLGSYGAPQQQVRAPKLPEARLELESTLIRAALKTTQGNQSAAAALLGITEQSLRYWLRKNGVTATRSNQRTR